MKTTESTYTQMGMAALLPGMVHVLDIVQREVDGLREQLAALQGHKKLGRPPKSAAPIGNTIVAAPKRGWSDDPAERKAEMRRRMKVAAKRRKAEAQAVAA
jgi:hypothetical protein